MKIYISYFSNVKNIPPNLAFVAISRGVPEYLKGNESLHLYQKLSPSQSLLNAYKNNKISEDQYIFRYKEETLNILNPIEVKNDLSDFGTELVLLCYEKPTKFCHRHLAAKWLRSKLLIDVQEYPI